MITPLELGPLARLVGTWEGERGLDVSYSHEKSTESENGLFERMTFSSFGPVDNGSQILFGLDYRTAAWRHGEEAEDPFHTEIGYWLWDSARGEVMRCFMVPRGVSILAIGSAEGGDTNFSMQAERGSVTNGILSNPYLDEASKSVSYSLDVDLSVDGQFAYSEDLVLEMNVQSGLYHHTDANTLRRVD
jgi:hypothetical protein